MLTAESRQAESRQAGTLQGAKGTARPFRTGVPRATLDVLRER